jgi:hypothetical protein
MEDDQRTTITDIMNGAAGNLRSELGKLTTEKHKEGGNETAQFVPPPPLPTQKFKDLSDDESDSDKKHKSKRKKGHKEKKSSAKKTRKRSREDEYSDTGSERSGSKRHRGSVGSGGSEYSDNEKPLTPQEAMKRKAEDIAYIEQHYYMLGEKPPKFNEKTPQDQIDFEKNKIKTRVAIKQGSEFLFNTMYWTNAGVEYCNSTFLNDKFALKEYTRYFEGQKPEFIPVLEEIASAHPEMVNIMPPYFKLGMMWAKSITMYHKEQSKMLDEDRKKALEYEREMTRLKMLREITPGDPVVTQRINELVKERAPEEKVSIDFGIGRKAPVMPPPQVDVVERPRINNMIPLEEEEGEAEAKVQEDPFK